MKNLITIYFIALSIVSFGQIDRSKAPLPQPNPTINIPEPTIQELDNGLKVIIVENHKLPKISIQLFIDNPNSLENEKVGVSEIFGDMMGAGSSDYTKTEFDEEIDFIGASFSTNSRGFYASSLSKHSYKLLALIKSAIQSPSFPESEFERIKKQFLSGLSANKTDANAMAGNIGNVINYGTSHPYGEVTTEESVNNVSLEDVKAYYNSQFKPNNAYLVIVGDVTIEDGKNIAQKYFGDWKKSENEFTKNNFTSPTTKNNQVYFANKPGAVQSLIKISHTLDLKPGHPDAIKLSILNSILGGGSFSARLMSNLREDKAYTYGCYSSIQTDILKGEFTAGGSFRNEVTDSAVTQIIYEIKKISSELVSDEELDLVKKSRTGAFARALENPQTVARFALNTIRYNLPNDYYSNYLKQIESVTKEDLLAAAKQYLTPEKLNIIVVGNSEISEKLARFDSDNKIDFKNGYGQTEENLKQAPANVTTTSIINKFIHKVYMTEDDAIISKKDAKIVIITKQYDGMMKQMGMAFELTSAAADPNKSAMQFKLNGNVMQKEYFNGVSGKAEAMGNSKDFDEKQIKAKSVSSFPFEQKHYLTDDNYLVKLMGIDIKDGISYYKLEVKNKQSEAIIYEYYNIETGLLHIQETNQAGPDGKSIQSIVTMKDYISYGKGSTTLLIPSKQEINNAGNILELTLKTVEFGKKYNASIFEGGLK